MRDLPPWTRAYKATDRDDKRLTRLPKEFFSTSYLQHCSFIIYFNAMYKHILYGYLRKKKKK